MYDYPVVQTGTEESWNVYFVNHDMIDYDAIHFLEIIIKIITSYQYNYCLNVESKFNIYKGVSKWPKWLWVQMAKMAQQRKVTTRDSRVSICPLIPKLSIYFSTIFRHIREGKDFERWPYSILHIVYITFIYRNMNGLCYKYIVFDKTDLYLIRNPTT